jgi:hypothetical protein
VPRPSLDTFVLVLEDEHGNNAAPFHLRRAGLAGRQTTRSWFADHFFDVVEAVRHVDRGVYATLIVRPK